MLLLDARTADPRVDRSRVSGFPAPRSALHAIDASVACQTFRSGLGGA